MRHLWTQREIGAPAKALWSLLEGGNMKYIGRIAQVGAALWIYNVWFHRFNKDTGYRGGDARNMREEFAEYGFPPPAMYAVGATKVGLATALLAGLWVPRLVRPAAIGLAAFMLGAIGMHVKVKDPVKRATPAMTVFTLSAVAAVLAPSNRSAC